MTGRPIILTLRGLLLTGALSAAFGGACSAQQSTPATKYDNVEVPKSMRVYAPIMSQTDRDALTIKAIIFAAAGLGAVIALIVWRSMPPKTDKTAGSSGQTISATDSGTAATPPAAAPENQDAAVAEKPASESPSPSTTEAGTPVAESVEVTTPAETKSES